MANTEPIDPPARPAGLLRDPTLRALAIFFAGMALLLAIDLADRPTGPLGQDRAIEGALSAGNRALAAVAEESAAPADDTPDTAERRERARSSAFFLEQANLAWRRGDERAPAQLEIEAGSAALLAILGKLWALGWLLLPLGALAARLVCPRMEGRHRHWMIAFAGTGLGLSAGCVALALGIYALGAPAPFVIAPLVSAIVALNAWLLAEHARLDRSATLLRLAPLLVLLTVLLMLAREILRALALIP